MWTYEIRESPDGAGKGAVVAAGEIDGPAEDNDDDSGRRGYDKRGNVRLQPEGRATAALVDAHKAGKPRRGGQLVLRLFDETGAQRAENAFDH